MTTPNSEEISPAQARNILAAIAVQSLIQEFESRSPVAVHRELIAMSIALTEEDGIENAEKRLAGMFTGAQAVITYLLLEIKRLGGDDPRDVLQHLGASMQDLR